MLNAMLLWPLLVGGALAEELRVLGDPEPDLTLVQKRLRLAPSELIRQELAPLLADRAPHGQGLHYVPCTSEVIGPDSLGTFVLQITEHENVGEWQQAAATADAGQAALGCLDGFADPEVASRLSYLAGVFAARAGNVEQAASSYQTALAFTPELAWDGDFNVEKAGGKIFESKKADRARTTLSIWPPAAAGQVAFDGHILLAGTQTLEVRPGRHLLQVATNTTTSGWVDITDAESARLVLPALTPSLGDSLYASELGRTALSLSLEGALPAGTHFAVTVDELVWTGEVGAVAFKRHSRSQHTGSTLLGGGLVVSALGSAGALTTWALGHSAVVACKNADPGSCAPPGTYNAMLTANQVSFGLVGVGLTAAGTGILLRGRL